MSGHSKWSKIHRQKSVADAKKGALFTKLGNAITLAASQGDANPEMNFKLKLAIDQAKAANMPKENIERAIKRGTGELAGGKIEEITYEGFGPQGIALYIETLTDNRNRTTSEIKNILTKFGGSLGGPKSVAWLFEKKGVIRIMKPDKPLREELELKIIDAGAQDIIEEEETLAIYTKPEELQEVKENLEKQNIKIEYAEIEMKAKEEKEIHDDKLKQTLEKLFETLDESEDINNYFTNVQIN